MSEVAIDKAVWAGFGLVRRAPNAFFLWALVYAVLGMGPVIALYALIGPEYVEFMQLSFDPGAEPDPVRLNALMSQINGVQGITVLTGLASYAVMFSAIFRAILEPENKRFGYLRLGADEFRQAAMITVLYIGLVVGLAVSIVVMGLLIIAIGAVMGSVATGVVLGIAAFFALAGVSIWLAARLSMLLPMTFAQKKFMLGPAWALTRGHTKRLVLTTLIVVLMVIVMSLVLVAIYGAAAVALFASLGDMEAFTAYFSRPAEALFRDLTPWGLGLTLVASVWGTLYVVITAAPWAVIYRQLAGDQQAIESVFA